MTTRLSSNRRGSVVDIQFDDAGMNLLSAAALDELEHAIASLDSDTRVVTFRSGRDHVFAAGADMAEMREFDGEAARRFAEKGQSLFARIESVPFLTIALVDGDCFGGALDLAMAFDFRFAAKRSRFSHPGARLGIVTGFGGTHRWRSVISRKRMARLMLENQVLTAADAFSIGLVDALFDSLTDGSVDGEVARLASIEPARVRFVKEVVLHGTRVPDAELPTLARSLWELYEK